MKNIKNYKLLVAHDKKIRETYKKISLELLNDDYSNVKISCKNLLELIKVETKMLDKMSEEELSYYVLIADTIFTMDEVDDETFRASEKITQAYKAKFEKCVEYDFSEEEDDFEKLTRTAFEFGYSQKDLDRYFEYEQAYRYNAVCYACKMILNDELGIKKSNPKFYNELKETCIQNLIYYAFHSYEVECYILSHNMQMDYVEENYDDYFNSLNEKECKNIINMDKDASDNEDAINAYITLENIYRFRCYLHSLGRRELTNIFDYIIFLKESHSSKMLDYYENIVIDKINDLAR